MASPQLRLLEVLQFPGVSRETTAVLTSLLRRCANDHNLSAYVLQCVDEALEVQDQRFSLMYLYRLESCRCNHPLSDCRLLRAELVKVVGDALNDEAVRWMSDFLLIAIGKRNHQHRVRSPHPFAPQQRQDRCHPARKEIEETQDMHVCLRDGPRCSVSGSIHNIVCSQLIPISDDMGRLARFRILARVFFQAGVSSLSDVQLQSTENALMISMYWKDRLDRGCLTFSCIDGDFYAIPVSRDDSDALAEERLLNGLQGPTILELYKGIAARRHPQLSAQLAWVHQVITRTWLETGLASRLDEERDWVEKLPKRVQSMENLSPNEFGLLLKHRLMLM